MNKYAKGTMLVGVGFIGGAAYGGLKLINYALANEHIRKGVNEAICNKLDGWLWSEKPYYRDVRPVSYRKYYEDRYKDVYTFDTIFYPTREEAEKILSGMNKILDEYGLVHVSDMMELAGQSCSYKANAFGWTDLEGVEVEYESKCGYTIDLPDPIKIN